MNGVKTPKDSLILFEKKEATSFEEAYPLGNGHLGAMVYGGARQDTLTLNHDELWSGYPRNNIFRGQKKASLDRAKALVREQKYSEADDELSEGFGSYGSATFLPMGTLTVDYDLGNAHVTAYERTLDLATAIASTRYKAGGAVHTRTAYASYPQNVLVYRSESESGSFGARISLTCQLYSKTYTLQEHPMLVLEGECPATSKQCMMRTDRNVLYSDAPEARGIRFLCAALLHTDGKIDNKGNAFSISGASFIEIRLAAETSFHGYEKHPFLDGKEYKNTCINRLLALHTLAEADLRAAHVKDYKKYFGRLSLSLGTSNKGRVPTSLRLARFAAGAKDTALPALLFNFGRYLTIAASRKGTEPTNLQGIWNEHFFAPWHSNYTLNINTQMNYFPTLGVGLPEMYEPLLRMIFELREAGRVTASEMYGAGGWCCHHNTDLWRHTQPVMGKARYLFFHASAWLCHHLTEYYDYTLDRKFLEKFAFSTMCEAAEFYLTQLETAPDGTRVVFPATSPENTFTYAGGDAAVSETTEMAMATVRELFSDICRFARLLGVSNELTEKIEKELPHLRKTVIGSDGKIEEWYGEQQEIDPHHRHISHLYALHPGHEISPLTTPELANACKNTLAARGDAGTGWGLAWKCNCYARLHQGDRALDLIRRQLTLTTERGTDYHGRGGSYPNLLCAHPPFQIDGNFGVTAGLLEMLLQSSPDTVHIAPALPTEWQNVSVRGIRAKGKRHVSFKITDGKLTACEISGTAPEKIYVGGIDKTAYFIYQNGKSIFKID